MPNHPLAEVFGFRFDDMSDEAQRYRRNRLCPYNNRVPSCTKDKAEDPLGTCSLFGGQQGSQVIVTCPVRFRQDWRIATDAADFFFPPGATWTTLNEVRLPDASGKSAGNIDLVLVQYDFQGKIVNYGAVEVQAVYISGNVRDPFTYYMQNPETHQNMDWTREPKYPRADYLSSSRKRLAPQLIFKGGILHAWKRKIVVVLDTGFFNTLPPLTECAPEKAEVAWFVYELALDTTTNRYQMRRNRTVYTLFSEALEQISVSKPGDEGVFLNRLAAKLSSVLPIDSEGAPPENQTLTFALSDDTDLEVNKEEEYESGNDA